MVCSICGMVSGSRNLECLGPEKIVRYQLSLGRGAIHKTKGSIFFWGTISSGRLVTESASANNFPMRGQIPSSLGELGAFERETACGPDAFGRRHTDMNRVYHSTGLCKGAYVVGWGGGERFQAEGNLPSGGGVVQKLTGGR